MTAAQSSNTSGVASSGRGMYTIGRLFGVSSRPLFLLVANNLLAPAATQGLAVALLASSLTLVLIAADPHRRFYASQFGENRKSNAMPFVLYAGSVVLVTAAGAIAVSAVSLIRGASAWLMLAGTAYFVTEKLADEVLRLWLFERDFAAWGKAVLTRSLLQLVGLGGLIAAVGTRTTGTMAVAALALGNVFVFVPRVPASAWRLFSLERPRRAFWILARSARSLHKNWYLWGTALGSSGIGYLDRLLALFVRRELLPLFALVVMCFSVVQMAVDFFYVSRHRRDFLQHRIRLTDALRSRDFLVSFFTGLGGALAACFALLYSARDGASFPLMFVAAIAILQSSFAVSTVVREIAYWRFKPSRLLRIEIAFWAVLAAAILASAVMKRSASELLAVATLCVVTRLALFAVLAAEE